MEYGFIWYLGVPYGALRGIYSGAIDEEVSSYLRPVNAVWNVIPGIYQGCYDGLKYGYNLRYNNGRSVEGDIFDLIEFSEKQAEKFCFSH